MSLNPLSAIAGIVGSVTGLIDDMHTSDDEKLTAKSALATLQIQLATQALDFERAQIQAQASIVKAEAESTHVLTSIWRPVTMLTFVAIIVLAQFGIGPAVPDQMWPLLKLGLGGYVIGRSAEKVIPATVAAMKTREQA